MTVLQKEGKLRKNGRKQKQKEKHGWQIRLESRIQAIRRKLSYTHVFIECHKSKKYTKHQRNIKNKMEKQYGMITTDRLKYLKANLKQELKVESLKLRNKKVIQERSNINRMFKISPKKVYRSMKGECSGPVKEMPTKEETQNFWSSLWGKPVHHNKNAPWLQFLKEEYCVDATQEPYEITDEILNKILNKPANDKPGRDKVTGLWIKRLKSIRQPFKDQLSQMYKGEQAPPDWLMKSMTLLLHKSKDTIQPKNYMPIALQNSMYKVYTEIIAEFIMDHCERNKIIAEEQAAGKRSSWGCADQLLINKMIYEEVTQARKNLVTVWLDYQKAFDSVPHSGIIESLELAKVPPAVIKAIEQLMYKSKTQALLNGETSNIETDFISYLRGILQGDTLSLILFVLSVNPLPFLLRNHEGYKIKNKKKKNITNLFFVDDLKLYAQNIEKMIDLGDSYNILT